MENQQDKDENVYVVVVSKKLRNLKKKLGNIQKIEAQLVAGKQLNEEQTILFNSKASVERSITDLEQIKTQLEEVARDEKLKQTSNVNVSESPVESTEHVAPTVEAVEASTATNSVEQKQQETQHDTGAKYDQDIFNNQIHKLLKLLHVCAKYQMVTGQVLPPDVDYFGQCLLGHTSISNFRDTLNQSARNAELYLDVERAHQFEAIRGMTYSQLSDIIDNMALEIEGGVVGIPPVINVEEEPQINFFAESPVEHHPPYQFVPAEHHQFIPPPMPWGAAPPIDPHHLIPPESVHPPIIPTTTPEVPSLPTQSIETVESGESAEGAEKEKKPRASRGGRGRGGRGGRGGDRQKLHEGVVKQEEEQPNDASTNGENGERKGGRDNTRVHKYVRNENRVKKDRESKENRAPSNQKEREEGTASGSKSEKKEGELKAKPTYRSVTAVPPAHAPVAAPVSNIETSHKQPNATQVPHVKDAPAKSTNNSHNNQQQRRTEHSGRGGGSGRGQGHGGRGNQQQQKPKEAN